MILKTYGEDKDLEYIISVTELPKVEIKSVENIKFDDYDVSIDSFESEKDLKKLQNQKILLKLIQQKLLMTEI